MQSILKKYYLVYWCAVLTKHVSGVLVEMKFDDDTAIENG